MYKKKGVLRIRDQKQEIRDDLVSSMIRDQAAESTDFQDRREASEADKKTSKKKLYLIMFYFSIPHYSFCKLCRNLSDPGFKIFVLTFNQRSWFSISFDVLFLIVK